LSRQAESLTYVKPGERGAAMTYKIHPAIGIARVGDSKEFYLAPEQAGRLPILPGGRPFTSADFRDGHKRLRRQAPRFEVYQYAEARPRRSRRPGTAGRRRGRPDRVDGPPGEQEGDLVPVHGPLRRGRTHWKALGVVFDEGSEGRPRFVEVERTLKRHRTATGAWGDAPVPE
jgi:hypothetical protein